jgi:hypothetical protein
MNLFMYFMFRIPLRQFVVWVYSDRIIKKQISAGLEYAYIDKLNLNV